MTEERKKHGRKSKTTVMVIFVLCVAVLACYVLIEGVDLIKKTDDSPKSMYSDKLYSYVFYPTDFDLDVTKDEIYMGHDREIHYKKGSVSYSISEADKESNAAIAFFAYYFECAIAGDTETYNTLFTENYYKTNKPYVQFAPQMIYNIEIEELSAKPGDDGSTTYAFNVTYMIHRNDGTFRNDIDSDAAKTLYYELIESTDGVVMIDRITYYK